MQQEQNLSSQEKDNLAGEVMESLGEPSDKAEVINETPVEEKDQDDLPLVAKQRLGRQEKRHRKEMREMNARIEALNSRLGDQTSYHASENPNTPYSGQAMEPGSEEERIHRAVVYALRAKEDQERKVKEAEKAAHVHRQYQAFENNLDKASDEYEDFDDVVRSKNAPFTEAMRDAALMLPDELQAKVLYQLGKNENELKRISALHPLDQAREMIKLSHALTAGGGENKVNNSQYKPLGQIKSKPVTSSPQITDKSSVAEIRERMKANWK